MNIIPVASNAIILQLENGAIVDLRDVDGDLHIAPHFEKFGIKSESIRNKVVIHTVSREEVEDKERRR